MIANSLCIANGKGGVGKTSITANLAGVAALGGWRVLAIDLDPQGNLGSDLGYKQKGRGDEGDSLARAVLEGAPIEPLREVRPRLDVVPAGAKTVDLEALLTSRRVADPARIRDLGAALAPLTARYDLTLLDCPPATGVMVDAALAAARWLAIPVKFDDGSIDGLELMARHFGAIRRAFNPTLELMGVILFDFSTASTRIRQEVRATLDLELGGIAPVFETVIRKSERGAYDMRRRGLLAYEYEAAAIDSQRKVSVGERIRSSRQGNPVEAFSAAAGGLAEDYTNLANEILAAFDGRPPPSGDPWGLVPERRS